MSTFLVNMFCFYIVCSSWANRPFASKIYLILSYHIPCDAHQAIPFTMQCPPDHTIYHVVPARPCYIQCHARQAIPYTCDPAMQHHKQSYISSGNTIYHDMSARTYHIPCQVRQAIPYTIPCPPSHSIYYVMPARPYHILC